MQITLGNDNTDLCDELIAKINVFFMNCFHDFTYSVNAFSNPSEFCEFCMSTPQDIIFIDASCDNAPGLGLHLATELRKLYPMCHIIFFTDNENYLKVSVNELIRPSGYFVRPITYTQLSKLLNEIINTYYNHIETLNITSNNETFFMNLSDIIYIEKIDRKISIVTDFNILEKNMTLKATMKYLNKQFFMVEEGTIINLEKIKSINYSENLINMVNGKSVLLARARKKELKNKIMNIQWSKAI